MNRAFKCLPVTGLLALILMSFSLFGNSSGKPQGKSCRAACNTAYMACIEEAHLMGSDEKSLKACEVKKNQCLKACK